MQHTGAVFRSAYPLLGSRTSHSCRTSSRPRGPGSPFPGSHSCYLPDASEYLRVMQQRWRRGRDKVRGARSLASKGIQVVQEHGVKELYAAARLYGDNRFRSRVSRLPGGRIPPAAGAGWPLSVLIVAERHLEQCWHYRVQQKLDALAQLGVPAWAASLSDPAEAITRLQLASVLVVYRQPDGPQLRAVLAEARRLRIPVVYELDDAMYRRDLLVDNPNFDTIPRGLRRQVEADADEILSAMRQADHVLASTELLAADMARHVRGDAFVVANGVDDTMLSIGRGVEIERAAGTLGVEQESLIVIYGSGSRAHDADLALAGPALAGLLAEHPRAKLRLVGPLALPVDLHPFSAQVERLAELNYGEYLREIARADIAIAPLLDGGMNQFKSNIKFLEASLVGVPVVASPTVYGETIVDGVTGLIARNPREWRDQLERLTADPGLRKALVAAAARDLNRAKLSNGPAHQLSAMLHALHPRGVAAGSAA